MQFEDSLKPGDEMELALAEGSSVGVIGGGPAGSFFSYFLLNMARRVDSDIKVTIYERRDFSKLGPLGCNMCGGVISESLIQALSIEGINLQSDVVQRGINSFIMHTKSESVEMYSPFNEMRIATVYRGGGPLGTRDLKWKSFDNYLLELAVSRGAKVVRDKVTDISLNGEKPLVHLKEGDAQIHDLLVGAMGVNSPTVALFEKLDIGYRPPKVRKVFNMEFALGSDYVRNKLGNALHVFLLNLPGLDCAALVPKGDYVTMCLIGDNIDKNFVDYFLQQPAVRKCLGDDKSHSSGVCSCSPNASFGDAVHPYGDRVLIIGDCGASRFNKDGIGSAYRTAKRAAATALFRGISSEDFDAGYWPVCRKIQYDNRFGKIIYGTADVIKKSRLLTRGVVRMTKSEQQMQGKMRYMSMVLWNMFTGSAPYRNVFMQTLHPFFISHFLWNIAFDSRNLSGKDENREDVMEKGDLGKTYRDGEVIVRQGEPGECMYVIQSGQVEVLQKEGEKEVHLALLGKGEVFGEMALFQKQTRSATVRALGDARILTVDKRIFLRRIHEDPSLAFTLLQMMSKRILALDTELVQAKALK